MDLRQWDPTTGWAPTSLADILVDLSAATVNGVGLGAPLEALAGWGKAETAFPLYSDDRRRVIGGTWYYQAVGLAVSAVGGRIESWDVDVEPTPRGRQRFQWQGAAVETGDLPGALGPAPGRRGSDMVYPARGWEMAVEVSAAGGIKSISLQETDS